MHSCGGSIRKVRWFFLFLVWALLAGGILRCRAAYDPPFDLDTCVGSAQLIVRGSIDGASRLSIEQVLAGDPGGAKVIALGNTDLYYNRARQGTVMKRSRAYLEWFWRRYLPWLERKEAVVFLQRRGFDGKWTTSGVRDTVWLRGAGVYPFDGFADDEAGPRYQRGPFFAALEEAIQVAAERTRLLNRPRSLERVPALLKLAVQHDPLPGATFFFENPFYHLSEIAKGFRNPSPEEQALLLQEIRVANSDGERAKLIRLAGLIPLRPEAFDSIVEFLDRNIPAEVREAAIDALAAIDSWRAEEVFAPLLTRADPQLRELLENLDPYRRAPFSPDWQEPIMNRSVVEPLIRLAKDMQTERERRAKWARATDFEFENQFSALTNRLEHFQHPHFLPLLMEWALAPDDRTARPARNILNTVTGLRIPTEATAAWETWWRGARSLLEPTYDLQSAAGRAAWMAAWTQGDAGVRHLLMNLWNYEPEIDEAALLAAVDHAAAAATLSELWQRQRLTPATQLALVQHFVRPFLVEQGDPQAPRCDREVRVKFKSSFPFPDNPYVEYRATVLVGDDPAQPTMAEVDATYSAMSLAGLISEDIGGWEGKFCGRPLARGFVILRSIDHRHERRLLWTTTWETAPLQLREVPR